MSRPDQTEQTSSLSSPARQVHSLTLSVLTPGRPPKKRRLNLLLPERIVRYIQHNPFFYEACKELHVCIYQQRQTEEEIKKTFRAQPKPSLEKPAVIPLIPLVQIGLIQNEEQQKRVVQMIGTKKCLLQ